ncbi:MAG: hypothetical protein NVS3B12_33780 [Acidimicrobiales bacterium]
MSSPWTAQNEGHTLHLDRAGPLFWLSAAAGWLVIAYGIRGLLAHHIDTRPANYARFAVGGALLHDLVFAPVIVLVGVAVSRVVRGRSRAPIQAGLLSSGLVALYSYPLIRGFGHANHNPTSLPHNYTANAAIVIGVIWAIAIAAAVTRSVGSRHH